MLSVEICRHNTMVLRVAEIVNGLFLCDLHAITNKEFTAKIDVFLSVCKASPEEWNMFVGSIKDRLIVVESISRDYAKLLKTMDALLQKGKSIAIFCETGEQRASAMVAAYLIFHARLDVDTTVKIVHSKFKHAFPNGCKFVSLLHVLRTEMPTLIE